jgi:hypothetical protein
MITALTKMLTPLLFMYSPEGAKQLFGNFASGPDMQKHPSSASGYNQKI